jgi:HAD superfamily hydrolase (TIGR01509 family)
MLKALIFDCDGVLADTERDGHRVAFNRAFAENGIDAEWDIDLYGKLLEVAGGRERMRHFFEMTGWPAGAETDRDAFIARVHADKSRTFRKLVRNGSLPLRPGIKRIVDEAHAGSLRLVVCSTASMESVLCVLDLLGPERKSWFEHVLAGDVVSRKKPDPAVYLLALERLGVDAAECVVIEDSRIGLQAALGAGIRCLVTTSAYTSEEDFHGASGVVGSLGEPPGEHVGLEELVRLCERGR